MQSYRRHTKIEKARAAAIKIMKITKSQLKQIIKEELESVLAEGPLRRARALQRAAAEKDKQSFEDLHEIMDAAAPILSNYENKINELLENKNLPYTFYLTGYKQNDMLVLRDTGGTARNSMGNVFKKR